MFPVQFVFLSDFTFDELDIAVNIEAAVFAVKRFEESVVAHPVGDTLTNPGIALGADIISRGNGDAFGGFFLFMDLVDEQEEAAKGIAIPAAYDVGAERNSWVSQGITNWMGDDGFLKSLYCEYRRFNVYGDIQFIKGKITKKYELNGEHLVDLDVWAENQRAEVTAPGKATVILPSKPIKT